MNIPVKVQSRVYKVAVETIEHDCYELADYRVEEFTFYSPTIQQLEEGTDHDEVGLEAICNKCGQDMLLVPYEDMEARYEQDC